MACELPIWSKAADIENAISTHSVVLINGETGCGKTQVVPELMLNVLGQGAKVVCTQPRIQAARGAAKKKAASWHSRLPGYVGFHADGNNCTVNWTTLCYATIETILNKTHQDPDLKQYSGICLDEVHELSVELDMLIKKVAKIQKRRKNFKVVLMSADVKYWKGFFEDAPVITVEGRCFPVDTSAEKPPEDTENDEALLQHTVEVTKAVLGEGAVQPGAAVLVFVPGLAWITEVVNAVKDLKMVKAFGLYSACSEEEVDDCMAEHKAFIKVIACTNIAETSLTIPDVAIVIDSGLSRCVTPDESPEESGALVYETSAITYISKMSAIQRAGRAGRVQAGQCIRLYEFNELEEMPPTPSYTLPNVLKALALDIPLSDFSTKVANLQTVTTQLRKSGCIDGSNGLLPKGRRILQFPFARFEDQLCQYEALGTEDSDMMFTILSLMQEFGRIQQKTDNKHVKEFRLAMEHPKSDFLTALQIFNSYVEDKQFATRYQLNLKAMKKAIHTIETEKIAVTRHFPTEAQEARILDIIATCYPHAVRTTDKLFLLRPCGNPNNLEDAGKVFGTISSYPTVAYRSASMMPSSGLPCRLLRGVTGLNIASANVAPPASEPLPPTPNPLPPPPTPNPSPPPPLHLPQQAPQALSGASVQPDCDVDWGADCGRHASCFTDSAETWKSGAADCDHTCWWTEGGGTCSSGAADCDRMGDQDTLLQSFAWQPHEAPLHPIGESLFAMEHSQTIVVQSDEKAAGGWWNSVKDCFPSATFEFEWLDKDAKGYEGVKVIMRENGRCVVGIGRGFHSKTVQRCGHIAACAVAKASGLTIWSGGELYLPPAWQQLCAVASLLHEQPEAPLPPPPQEPLVHEEPEAPPTPQEPLMHEEPEAPPPPQEPLMHEEPQAPEQQLAYFFAVDVEAAPLGLSLESRTLVVNAVKDNGSIQEWNERTRVVFERDMVKPADKLVRVNRSNLTDIGSLHAALETPGPYLLLFRRELTHV